MDALILILCWRFKILALKSPQELKNLSVNRSSFSLELFSMPRHSSLF